MTGILIDVDAKSKKAERDLEAINQSLKNIDKTTKGASESLRNAFVNVGKMAGLAGTLMLLGKTSDEFTQIGNKIATVTGRTKDFLGVQQQLYKVAEDTRASISGTVDTFASFGRSLSSAGVSSGKIISATKVVQQSIAISGANANSAAAALMQLGQGIASGTLRGEELNSVLEQTPRIAQAISDELGTTVGKLRLLAADGKLTSDVVFNALLHQSEKINKEFSAMKPTIGQSFTLLTDSTKIFVTEFDKGLGLSSLMGSKIYSLAKAIRSAADDAFLMGSGLSTALTRITGNIRIFSKPAGIILQELGKQFQSIIPEGFLTRSLRGDIRSAIRELDKFTGGWLGAWNRFKIVDLFTLESDVQIALRTLKRLSPKYWAAGGIDVKSISQFFSTENLMAYGKALDALARAVAGNTSTIGGFLTKMFKDIDYYSRSASRYLGFRMDTLIAFSAGNVENFLNTIAEVIRGLSGTAIIIFRMGEYLKTQFYPSLYGVLFALRDAFPVVVEEAKAAIFAAFGYLKSFLNGVTLTIYDLTSSLNFKYLAKDIGGFYGSVIDAINEATSLDTAYDKIVDFARNVIHEFWRIYDEVIGHSWWTDTVETIVDTSSTLWSRASKGLKSFSENTINIFANVFKKLKIPQINLDFLSNAKLKVPKVDFRGIKDSLSNITKDFRNSLKDFVKEYPGIVKVALLSVAALLSYLILPLNGFAATVVSVLFAELAGNAALLSESFGLAITGESFMKAFGERLGSLAAIFINATIQELPRLVGAIAGAIAGFVRGLVEGLLYIGPLMKGIFAGFDFLGMAGPLGLIGVWFFGKGLLSLSTMKLFKKKLGGFSTLMNTFKVFTSGGGGFLSYVLFGSASSVNIVSAVALILSNIGMLDSLLGASSLSKYAVEGGLLYLSLFGRKGLDNILKLFATQLATPARALFESAISQTGSKSMYDVFFGSVGTWPERASVAIKAVIDKVTSKAIDVVSPYATRGLDLLSALLFGKDPKATAAKLKGQFTSIVSSIGESFKAVTGGISSKFKAMSTFLDAQFGANGSKAYQNLGASFMAAPKQAADAKSKILKQVGDTGLLGTAFLGKHGKAIIVGTILALVGTLAMAQQTAQTAATKQTSIWDDFLKNFKMADLKTPILDSLFNGFLYIAIPAVSLALFALRNQILAMMATVGVAAMGALRSTTALAMGIKSAALVAAAGVGAGLLAQYMGADSEMAMVIGATVGGIVATSASSIITWLGTILTGAAAILAAKVLAALAAIVAVGGILYIALFGKKGEFWKEIDDVFEKLKSIAGFGKNISLQTGLKESSEKTLGKLNVGTTYDLRTINKSLMSSKDSDRLAKAVKAFEDAVQVATDQMETRADGGVTPEMFTELNTLNKRLSDLVPRVAARSTATGDFGQQLQTMNDKKLVSYADDFFNFFEQFKLNRLYALQETLINARPKPEKGQPNTTAEDLKTLAAEKSTKYSATYRPIRPEDAAIRDMEKQVKSLSFSSEKLTVEIDAVEQVYKAAFDKVAAETRRIGGLYIELPADNPYVKRLEVIRSQLEESYTQQIAFAERAKGVDAFKKSLQGVNAEMSAASISFDSKGLFASSDKDLKRLKDLSLNLKNLMADQEKAASVAEHNEIVYRITEIKTEVNRIVYEAEARGSVLAPQYNLQKLAEESGLPIFSAATYEKLTTDAATNFREALLQIRADRESLKQAYKLPANALDGSKASEYTATGINLDRTEEEARLKRRLAAVQKQILDAVSSSPEGKALASKDMASSLGLNFEELLKFRGLGGATEAILKLSEARDKLVNAKSADDMQRFQKEYSRLEDSLKNRKTLSDVISNVNASGAGIQMEDFASIGESGYKKLQAISAEVSSINIDLSMLGADASFEDAMSIVNRRVKETAKAYEILRGLAFSTPKKLSDSLMSAGFDSNAISKMGDGFFKEYQAVQTKISDLQNEMSKPGNKSREKELRQELAAAEKELARFKQRYQGLDAEFNSVSSSIGKDLTKIGFLSLPAEFRKALVDGANALELSSKDLRTDPKKYLSVLEAQRTSDFKTEQKLQSSGAYLRQSKGTLPTSTVDSMVSMITEASPALADFKSTLERLTIPSLQDLAKSALEVTDARRGFQIGNISGRALKEKSREFDAKGLSVIGASSASDALQYRMKAAGVEASEASMKLVNSATGQIISGLLAKIEEARSKLDLTNDPDQQAAWNRYIGELRSQINENVEMAAYSRYDVSRDAGRNFGQVTVDNFSTGFSDFLKDKRSEGKNAFETFALYLLDQFTSNVIDTLVKGLTETFANKSSTIMQVVSDFGRSMFDAFTGIGKGNSEGKSPISDLLSTGLGMLSTDGTSKSALADSTKETAGGSPIEALLGTLISTQLLGSPQESIQTGLLGEIVFSLGTANMILGNIAASTTAGAFFAEGGRIGGPGTGTSDSIPIMASNGEYVVNAQSTRRYLPLIRAINEGKLRGFAEGGLVSVVNRSGDLGKQQSSSTQNNQTINLQITGDISRQTRSEIYAMLPQIAEGVNSRNREKGYRN